MEALIKTLESILPAGFSWTTFLQGAAVLAAGFALQLCDGARLAWLTDRVRRWPVWMQGGLAAVAFTIILGLAPEGVAPFIYFQF